MYKRHIPVLILMASLYAPVKGAVRLSPLQDNIMMPKSLYQNNIIEFEDKPLKEIIKIISSLYKVQVICSNANLLDMRFTGSIDGQKSLKFNMNNLQATGVITYTIDQSTVYIKK